MGTWGDGLFDSDSALDFVGDMTNCEEAELAKLAAVGPTQRRAEQLAARLGLLLQLSPHSFSGPFGETLTQAVAAQQAAFGELKPAARRLLERIAEGEGTALSERSGKRKKDLQQALGGYLDGVREKALFATPEGGKVLQRFANRCLKELRSGLRARDLENLHVTGSLAALGLILLVDPPKVSVATLKKGLARLETLWAKQRRSGETEFWERLVPNAQLAFELAILRHGSRADAEAVKTARKERKAAERTAKRGAARAEKAAAAAEAKTRKKAQALRRGREGARGEQRIQLGLGRPIKKTQIARDLLAQLAGVLLGTVPVFEQTNVERGKGRSYTAEYRAEGAGAVLIESLRCDNPASGSSLSFDLRAGDVRVVLADSGWEPHLTRIDMRVQPCDAATQEALQAATAAFLG
jgi:hypothetical protein